MLCDDCKKNQACIRLTQVSNVNASKIDKHLCEECAKKYGDFIFNVNQNFSVNDFLAGMFNKSLPDTPQAQPRVEECPNCHMTYRDFSRNGKIGCSICYEIFAKKLEPLLRRLHGDSSHTGKIPKRSGGQIELRQRIIKMRKVLSNYVVNEEYEEAAKLRDEIKALEKELSSEVGREHE